MSEEIKSKDAQTPETVNYEEIIGGGKEGKKKRPKKEKKIKEKAQRTPEQKKKLRRRIIFGSVAGVIVVFFVVMKVMGSNTKPMVYTVPVTTGDVEQTISTSGKVETENAKTYFSELNVQIGEVKVQPGQVVKKGDVLLTYNADALAKEKELNELSLQAADGSYQSSMSKNNKESADLTEANTNLDVLNQQITDTQNYIDGLNRKIEDKRKELAHYGALLQISLLDWADKPDSDEYLNLQKLVQENTYEQEYNKDIVGWKRELEEYNEMLADYKEYKSEMQSQQVAAEGSVLNSGGKSELAAKNKTESIKAQDTLNSIAKVEEGLRAEFNGVVTSVSVVDGATPQEGAELVKVESTDEVKLSIAVSKYDLTKVAVGQKADITIAGNTYEGELSSIAKMAVENNSGTPVVNADIRIKNPDEQIYLGVEAKVLLHTNKAEGVLVVPIEVVNTDQTGDFVYAVQDGIVVKKAVTTGLSSDMYTQIVDGLAEGDQILANVTAGIVEGMAVTAVPQQ